MDKSSEQSEAEHTAVRYKIAMESGGASTGVQRFWYDTYVRDMGRKVDGADRTEELLCDPLAHCSWLHVAKAELRIVGTVMSTPVAHVQCGLYEELYQLPGDEADRKGIAITTKLMVARDFRRGRLAVDLAAATYCQGLNSGISRCRIDCNLYLTSFFEGLGFRRLFDAVHPCYGEVSVMELELHDIAHLAQVRSPLLAYHELRAAL